MSYRLLALDIDGTLLRGDKTVSQRTRAAVQSARERGVRLVLVTGRRYPAARHVASGLGGPMDLVLHNGALIVSLGGEKGAASRTDDGATILRCRPLAREMARLAIRVARERGADAVVHAGQRGEGRLLVQDVASSNPLLTYYLDRSVADVVRVADLEAALDDLDPLQVMFGGALKEMETLLPLLAGRLGTGVRIERTVYPASGVGILDVLAAGVGKAEALGFLRQRLGVAAEETLAVGDNWNDQQMLEEAGLGLVMGNANAQMLALGLPVLPTNEEDGVAVAVERYILSEKRKRG